MICSRRLRVPLGVSIDETGIILGGSSVVLKVSSRHKRECTSRVSTARTAGPPFQTPKEDRLAAP